MSSCCKLIGQLAGKNYFVMVILPSWLTICFKVETSW